MSFSALAATALIATATALVATPVVARIMTRWGIVDRPDGRRKLHGRTVPLAGGIAVFAGVLVAVAVASALGMLPTQNVQFCTALLAGSLLICATGCADDAVALRGRHKLVGQIVASVIVVWGGGLVVRNVELFGYAIDLGFAAVPLTVFWLVGAINAINLIDGMDGLASTVGAMIAIAFCAMAVIGGRAFEAVLAAALAGGLIGFLRYNFPPARIFLGDTGSMLIGLLLGVIAARASLKGPATVALSAPVAIWTLPLLDVAMAILRRKLTGRSIYATDRGHLHHRLSDRGLSTRRALLLVASLCCVTTAGALASIVFRREWIAPLSAALVVGSLVLTRHFGHAECHLLLRRGRAFLVSLLPTRHPTKHQGQEHRSRLQGTREWDQLWESLVEFAQRFGLTSVQLDISLPALREEFFASWTRPVSLKETERQYRSEIPLTSSFGAFGTLRIAGRCPDEFACAWICELTEGLRPFEIQLAELLFDEACAAPQFRSVRPVVESAAWEGRPKPLRGERALAEYRGQDDTRLMAEDETLGNEALAGLAD